MKECLPSSKLGVNELFYDLIGRIYFSVQYDDDAFERQHPVMYLDLDAWCSVSPPIDSLTHFPFPSEFCSFCLIVRSMYGFEPGQVCSKPHPCPRNPLLFSYRKSDMATPGIDTIPSKIPNFRSNLAGFVK
jgi:hypothetical protein